MGLTARRKALLKLALETLLLVGVVVLLFVVSRAAGAAAQIAAIGATIFAVVHLGLAWRDFRRGPNGSPTDREMKDQP